MTNRKSKGPSKERFIVETLALINEKGSSKGVNLREISRRVGCAHTNAYNYFSSFDDLMWEAFNRALTRYAQAIVAKLDDSLPSRMYFRQLIGNMVGFARDTPGWYRFIGSDPINPDDIPAEIIETLIRMKHFFIESMFALSAGKIDREKAGNMGNIILAYLGGEILDLINGRMLPDENIINCVLENAEQLFTALSSTNNDGIVLSDDQPKSGTRKFPRLEIKRHDSP